MHRFKDASAANLRHLYLMTRMLDKFIDNVEPVSELMIDCSISICLERIHREVADVFREH